MLNRKMERQIILLLIVTLLLFLLALSSKSIWLLVLTMPLMGVDYWMIYKHCRCPHCGAHYKGLHWSAPDAGECPECHELMEYDE